MSAIERGGGRPKGNGGYKNADGKSIASVTTVLGETIPKKALVQWAYNRGKAGVALYASRDIAGEIGSAVHDAVEEFEFSGTLPTFENLRPDALGEEELSPRKSAELAFGKYRDWRAWEKFEVVAMEVPLISDRLGYAGTPDMVAIREGGALTLFDWKTGGAVYAEAIIQVAAYILLWEDLRGGHFETAEVLRLAKDGSDFEHVPVTRSELEDAGAFSAWRRCLELYNIMPNIKSLVKPKKAA